jgi:uncharacterized membrane protein
VRAVLLYSVLRVLAFAVPFGILYAMGLDWWIAALVAAALGFCVSYIFLRRQREHVAVQLAEARANGPKPRADEDAEDAPPAP